MDLRSRVDFWNYITQTQRDLMLEGDYLNEEILKKCKYCFRDYSFLVFPFAKAYEGFLKKICYDVGFLSEKDYFSDFLRLGKLLSPNLVGRLGKESLYKMIKDTVSADMADELWLTWKHGRNQVFHYFPHNIKALTYEEADEIIDNMKQTMLDSYDKLKDRIIDRPDITT